MAEVTTYRFLVYGSPAGFQTYRAQIALADAEGKRIAVMRFGDTGGQIESDYESEGVIYMHLPAILFGQVIDVLRNEGPIFIYFNGGIGILGSSAEPIGEGEKS